MLCREQFALNLCVKAVSVVLGADYIPLSLCAGCVSGCIFVSGFALGFFRVIKRRRKACFGGV